jgi:aspartyl-tRNA(Asn)/glutamyl-tRNA(Gln) amidotransferase subunit C
MSMAITDNDVARIARLARIELSESGNLRARDDLNHILQLIAQLQAVDTSGIEPMAHPLAAHANITLRLRPDQPAPRHTAEQRRLLMGNSPAGENTLFLVPTVIE